jgi:hypothetical protein
MSNYFASASTFTLCMDVCLFVGEGGIVYAFYVHRHTFTIAYMKYSRLCVSVCVCVVYVSVFFVLSLYTYMHAWIHACSTECICRMCNYDKYA